MTGLRGAQEISRAHCFQRGPTRRREGLVCMWDMRANELGLGWKPREERKPAGSLILCPSQPHGSHVIFDQPHLSCHDTVKPSETLSQINLPSSGMTPVLCRSHDMPTSTPRMAQPALLCWLENGEVKPMVATSKITKTKG